MTEARRRCRAHAMRPRFDLSCGVVSGRSKASDTAPVNREHRATDAEPDSTLVSVCLPVRNGADRLPVVIGSVLAQTHENLELVVSDNASTDGTETSAVSWRHRIRASSTTDTPRTSDSSTTSSRRCGCREGSFFRWVGHDDWLPPHSIAHSLDALRDDDRPILATTRVAYTDEGGETITDDRYDGMLLASDDPIVRLAEMLRLLNESAFLVDPLYGFFRRSPVSLIPRRNMVKEDEVFAAKLALAGPWVHVPEVLIHRTTRSDSLYAIARRLDVPPWEAVYRRRIAVPGDAALAPACATDPPAASTGASRGAAHVRRPPAPHDRASNAQAGSHGCRRRPSRVVTTRTSETGLSSGLRWSGVSVVGREATRIVFTILLARFVGPEAFGIVAQAIVYIGIVGLLLDQGFSSALIQRPRVEPDMPGAVVSVNLAVGTSLMLVTIAVASAWADFMGTPELTLVLIFLAPTLLIRAACVTPRAMLLRNMNFRTIAAMDVTAAFAGGALGVTAALLGASYWALVVQILTTDVVMLLVLLLAGVGIRPNRQFERLREIMAFSWRAFTSGLLINSISRNIDNLLVGKFQGPEALAFYGLAYRMLLLPVQLLSMTVGAVLFPAFSRSAEDLDHIRSELTRATRTLASLVLPAMALVAAAAPQLVAILFGKAWEPAVPIVQVLAMVGAVQAIYHPSTTPLVLGLGHAGLNLRYSVLTTIVSTVGIVAGVPFGPLGVAVGYAIASALLVPVEWIIRRRLLGIPLREQALTLVPGVHVALWAAVTYVLVAFAVAGHDLAVLGLGSAAPSESPSSSCGSRTSLAIQRPGASGQPHARARRQDRSRRRAETV